MTFVGGSNIVFVGLEEDINSILEMLPEMRLGFCMFETRPMGYGS